MQCPTRAGDSVEMLVAHAAGQLEGERAALVERHLEECPGCRELFESQRSVWTALDEWEPEPVSADFDARLYRTIEARDQSSWWRQLFRPVLPFSMRPALPLAAACLMLVAALLVRMPPDPATSAVAGETVDIEQVERALEDMEMLFVLDVALTEEAEGTRTL